MKRFGKRTKVLKQYMPQHIIQEWLPEIHKKDVVVRTLSANSLPALISVCHCYEFQIQDPRRLGMIGLDGRTLTNIKVRAMMIADS